MDQFAPINLSPLPTAPAPCELPYDLTWDDLLPILPGFDPERRHLAQAFASHRKQGLNGGPNSIILTLRCPGAEERVVFVKSQTDRLLWEAEKYRYLEAHGVPTPRLLAGLRKAEGKGEAEVIVLEFLPRIGIDFASASEVDAVLRLAAKINALPIPPSGAPGLFDPPPLMPQDVFDGLVHAALERMAGNPALPEIDVPRWLAAYRQCRAVTERMPRAVNHYQFFFQQMGWREHELVVFDLETMCRGPRFADLAGILYALSRFSGRAQEDLLRGYLEALRPLTADLPVFAGALRELRILRVAEMGANLPWLSEEGADLDGFDSASVLWMAADCMMKDIEALG